MRLSNLIIKPVVTEKTYSQLNNNRYSFKVVRNSSKETVAREIEKMYKVEVIDTRVSIVPGKLRRVAGTRRFSLREKWKKVTVTLKEGQKIDIMPKE